MDNDDNGNKNDDNYAKERNKEIKRERHISRVRVVQVMDFDTSDAIREIDICDVNT